jgi:hypothetical protein
MDDSRPSDGFQTGLRREQVIAQAVLVALLAEQSERRALTCLDLVEAIRRLHELPPSANGWLNQTAGSFRIRFAVKSGYTSPDLPAALQVGRTLHLSTVGQGGLIRPDQALPTYERSIRLGRRDRQALARAVKGDLVDVTSAGD